MIVLCILLVLLVAGLIAWERLSREPPTPNPPGRAGSTGTGTAAQQQARKLIRRNDPPRFQGRGVSTAAGAGNRGGAGAPARRTGVRFSPASTANPRFSGEVRRSPDAIGLACGRPIAECDRGADCLCVD